MCPGCILAGSVWGTLWCAGKVISFRAHRRQARAMAAVEDTYEPPQAVAHDAGQDEEPIASGMASRHASSVG